MKIAKKKKKKKKYTHYNQKQNILLIFVFSMKPKSQYCIKISHIGLTSPYMINGRPLIELCCPFIKHCLYDYAQTKALSVPLALHNGILSFFTFTYLPLRGNGLTLILYTSFHGYFITLFTNPLHAVTLKDWAN